MTKNKFSSKYKSKFVEKKPTIVNFLVKSGSILGIFLVLYILGMSTVAVIVDIGTADISDKEAIRYLDSKYYEKEYGDMRSILQLYDLYDVKYDIYWEIADGYEDFVQYNQWRAAKEEGLADCEDEIEYYRQKVIANAENCQFEKNRDKLQSYAEQIK